MFSFGCDEGLGRVVGFQWDPADKGFLMAELNIHEEIERGDNDSIKIAGKNVKVDKPCSS